MIKSKVYRLKKDTEVSKGVHLKRGDEIVIANDVVFIGGNIIPPSMQEMFYSWLVNNPTLFIDDTRTW